MERERTDPIPLTAHRHEAIFVVFDRKLEFVNDSFAELFGVSPEEACSSDFDPMTLIAPESHRFIQEQYRKLCRDAFTTRQFNYSGLSRDGLKIEYQALLLIIPYKWGLAIQGTLRGTSVSKRIDASLQRRRSDLPVVLNTVPTSLLCADKDHLFMQANEKFDASNRLPLTHIPRGDYPVYQTNVMGL